MINTVTYTRIILLVTKLEDWIQYSKILYSEGD
jgi:hypothetical protein